MQDKDRRLSQQLAREHLERGDGQGWFEELYRQAAGDLSVVPWADMQPHPLLLELLDQLEGRLNGPAVVVGCGLGDDAEELARRGYSVTAFDLAPTAIEWCRKRWPESRVSYRQADLLDPPADMLGRFSTVVEIHTLQAVPEELRRRMLAPLASLLAPGGRLLLICRVREEDEEIDGPPWALSRSELELLCTQCGLETELFEYHATGGETGSPRWFCVFRRPPA
ncbi:class I SAM-dependent methyltransferase [bacterium]|nr:class I SAM-dependent methyltransferase [bacterium]